ncbi:LysR family transcriptional regulator [Sneathiella glossodoripedis]|uniref:LysR family transcriptional regulator n=1 Tax=Sneathiella glossodoripedis TaxID=418853 RepID=UPI00046ECFF0|nr:LysR family transcriptional regulator [Sneathiella glossodoripedis]
MDLYQLRYFLALVETHNFSRAAERAFVSQPTLSAGIKKLETELGVTLFHRSKKHISLTEAGNKFLPRARSIIYECNAAKQEAAGTAQSTRLQIGLHRVLPIEHVANLLADFQKTYPDTQIALKEGSSETLEGLLSDGRINVAISTPTQTESGYRFERLFTSKCLLAVSKRHSFATKNSIDLSQLDRMDFIHRSHCITETEVTRAFSRASIRPHIVLRTDEDEKARALVSKGLGFCMMLDVLLTSEITFLPVNGLNISRQFGLIWQDSAKNELADAFRLFAASHNWINRSSEPANLEWAR